MTALAVEPTTTGPGGLLRAWRRQRRLSQLDLANLAEVSTRHLSCVETGRAAPSKAFLLHVAEHLDVPLRGRNDLLVAAGYPPVFGESDLDDPHLSAMSHVIDLVLGHHEPFPALVVTSRWDLVRANQGALALLDGVAPHLLEAPNVLRLALHPDGLAGRLHDLAAFSGHLLSRLRRQVALSGDPQVAALHDELAGYAGVTLTEPFDDHPGAVLPVTLRGPDGDLSFFTTVTTFGTAADVTLAELMIEAFYPADEATAEALRRRAAARPAGGAP